MYEMLKVVPLKPCEPSLTFQVWCNSTESWEKGQPLYRVMSVSRPEKLYYHLRRGSESWWFALTHIFTEAEIVDDTIWLWPDHRTSGQLIQPQTSQFCASKEAELVYCSCSVRTSPSAKGYTLWFCHIQNEAVPYNSIYMGRQTMQLRSVPPVVTAWIMQKWMNK